MDDLNRNLSRVRQLCSEFQIHKNAANQVSLRATWAVVSCADELEEDDTLTFAEDLGRLLEDFVHTTGNWVGINPLDVVVRQLAIANALKVLLESIQSLLLRYKDYIRFNSSKWTAEWEKARALDLLELDAATLEVAGSPHHMLQAQSLAPDETSDLCDLFESAMLRLSEDNQRVLRGAIVTLRAPTLHTLVDMTGRVRILGDSPMVAGDVANFWLAGTSSGNLVAAKVLRGFRAVKYLEDQSLPLLREARISSRFAHPNVLPTLGIAFIKDSLAILTPWLRNGNALDYLKRNPGMDTLQMAYEIAQGLQYLHSRGVVHGNLNSNSILVSEKGAAVISGFMFSLACLPEPLEGGSANEGNQPFDWEDADSLGPLNSRSYASKSRDIRAFGSFLSKLVSGKTVVRLGPKSRSTGIPQNFLPDSPFRQEIWSLIRQCTITEPHYNPSLKATTAGLIVAQLADLIARRDAMVAKDPSAAQRLWSNSSTAEHGVVLPDLSAEIRKMDTMPVTGGGFCDVWIGERLGKEKVALKVLKMFGVPEQIRRHFLAEATIWSQLKHQNILDFYGICDHGNSISMVSPWLANSNVLHYVNNVERNANRLKLLNDAAEGLLYLHTRSKPIVHGDLKCANILVKDDGTACLADFGLSKVHHEVTSSSLRDSGSQRFMAPELFNAWENETEPAKTLASDCYAFGQVIVELLSGLRPLSELIHEHLVFVAITRGHRAKRPDTEISRQWLTDPIWALVGRMTSTAKDRRPTMQEVTPQLRSFWVMSAVAPSDEELISSLSSATLSEG